MQLTSILSDLNSLRACDHAAALALVSARSSSDISSTSLNTSTTVDLQSASESDPDLRRPHELQTLHDSIKLAYGSASNPAPTAAVRELQDARNSVTRAILSLGLRPENELDRTNQRKEEPVQEPTRSAPLSQDLNKVVVEDDRVDEDYEDEDSAWA